MLILLWQLCCTALCLTIILFLEITHKIYGYNLVCWCNCESWVLSLDNCLQKFSSNSDIYMDLALWLIKCQSCCCVGYFYLLVTLTWHVVDPLMASDQNLASLGISIGWQDTLNNCELIVHNPHLSKFFSEKRHFVWLWTKRRYTCKFKWLHLRLFMITE